LPLPSGQKDGSGSSSPTHTNVAGLPIQKDEGSHSPSDQLPIPGKGTSSGQSTPSHDAVPGLAIPKQDGSKHIPSDALPLPSGQKDGSGNSSPTHTSVPGLPIKKGNSVKRTCS
ncbi:hypothetical protein T10_1133, partial [Trichinella papuae]